MATIEGARSSPGEGHSAGLIITQATVTTAQVLALFATPIEVIAAPGAGKAIILEGAIIHKPAGTAYGGIAAGEDLSLKYTNASGLAVAGCETTGFLDSASALTRWMNAYRAASAISDLVPVANAPMVLHLLTAEIATGTSDLILRLYHRIIPMVLA